MTTLAKPAIRSSGVFVLAGLFIKRMVTLSEG